jgi:hypothetical protein
MSLDAHLIHTCTIENPISGSVNAYNNAVPAFGAPVENVRCRLVESRERVWSTERQESAMQTVYKLLVGASVNLNERARISKVTLEDGAIVRDTFNVTEVLMRRRRSAHHQTAVLERIS